MKWFPNAHDASDDMARESPLSTSQWDAPSEKQKKVTPSRLSATFSDSRPWNFISSSQASDRSSSSSRKRRSLFGNRNSASSSSIAPSAETLNGHASPRPSCATHSSVRQDLGLGGLASASASKTSLSGDAWRSSFFSKRTSTRLARAGEELSRYGNNVRSSMDFRRRDDDSEEACESAHFGSGYLGDGPLTPKPKVFQRLKKNSISPPFNFQHITHTQKNHLPELDSVTDRELVSEFWAASAYQAPRTELRGINAQSIEKNLRPSNKSNPNALEVVGSPDTFKFKRGPLAGMSLSASSSPNLSRSLPDVDAITPVSESRPSLSRDGSRSFVRQCMSSAERLATIGVEQRDPPAMVHPALRGLSPSNGEIRSQSSVPIYELPATGLDSVPEETESSNVSPAKPRNGLGIITDEKPLPTLPNMITRAPKFTPFPMGNAFANAHGGLGEHLAVNNDQTSFNGEDSAPSMTSGESWENDVDFLYLVEAESTCNFDWASIKSSRQGSEDSQHRRDSGATSSILSGSVNGDARNRPSSRRNSDKTFQEEGLFAGFDGVSPGTVCAPTQKSFFAPPVSRRHSAISVSNAELTTIPELNRRGTKSDQEGSIGTFVVKPQGKHSRSASYSDQKPPAAKKSARWSIASPFHLPADVKNRLPSFTYSIKASVAEQMMFSAPLFPPPAAPLPELPKGRPTGLLSPPMSPPTLTMPDFTTVRRPSTPQDRALLQAAGRIVQRGRQSRPSTPSRLWHVQNVKDSPPQSDFSSPVTPPKMEPAHYGLTVFPTPPHSPLHQHEEYPAWI